MKNDSFEEMDKSLMKEMKALRERPVPPAYLEGFAQSVERKILDAEKPAVVAQPRRFTLPVWLPVAAVLVLAVTVVSNPLVQAPLSVPADSVQLASADVSEQELSDEIAVLTELGEWPEEEGASLETLTDADLEVLEYSDAGSPRTVLLA